MSLMSLEGKAKPGYSNCILINDSNNLAVVVQPRIAPQATKVDLQVLAVCTCWSDIAGKRHPT